MKKPLRVLLECIVVAFLVIIAIKTTKARIEAEMLYSEPLVQLTKGVILGTVIYLLIVLLLEITIWAKKEVKSRVNNKKKTNFGRQSTKTIRSPTKTSKSGKRRK